MARDQFTNPISLIPTMRPMGAAGISQEDDPKTRLEGAATRHNVPVNVLLAFEEAGGGGEDVAGRLAEVMKSGADLEAAVTSVVGDPAKAREITDRAYSIADELYPRQTETAPAEPQSRVESAAKSVLQGAANMVPSALRGVGEMSAKVQNTLSDAGDNTRESMGGINVERAQAELDRLSALKERFGDNPQVMAAIQAKEEEIRDLTAQRDAAIAYEPEIVSAKDTAGFQGGAVTQEWLDKNLPQPDAAYQDEFWTSKVPQGIGSMLGFIGTTVVSGLATGPGGALAATAGLGSAVNADSAYQDAINGGATEAQALDAAGLGGLVGTLEAVPILHGIDKIIPGGAGRFVDALKKITEGASEEAAQEAFNQVAQNLIAAGIYDPERGIMENVGESALIGAITGTMPAAIGAARGSGPDGGPVGNPAGAPRQQPDEEIPGGPGGPVGEVPGDMRADSPRGGVSPGAALAPEVMIDPVTGEVLPAAPAATRTMIDGRTGETYQEPVGPIEAASQRAAPPAPPPEPIFPDMKAGKEIQLREPGSSGRTFDAVFLRENPDRSVVVRIGADEIQIDGQEFASALGAARAADPDAEAKMATAAEATAVPPLPVSAPPPPRPFTLPKTIDETKSALDFALDQRMLEEFSGATNQELNDQIDELSQHLQALTKAEEAKAIKEAVPKPAKVTAPADMDAPQAKRAEVDAPSTAPDPALSPEAQRARDNFNGRKSESAEHAARTEALNAKLEKAKSYPPEGLPGKKYAMTTLTDHELEDGTWVSELHAEVPGFAGHGGRTDPHPTREAAREAAARSLRRSFAPIAAGKAASATATNQADAQRIMDWLDKVSPLPEPPNPATPTKAKPTTDRPTGKDEVPTVPETVEPGGKPSTEHFEAVAAEADPNPTDAQKEAENYKKGHTRWAGLELTIETAKGAERSGTAADGTKWSVTLPAHYGYIKRTEGADGDHVDIYMGENPESDVVLIVDQLDLATGKFDEHKVILGTKSAAAARKIYEAGFSDGKGAQRIGGTKKMTVEEFKTWLAEEDTSKPVGDSSRNEVDSPNDAMKSDKGARPLGADAEAKIAKIVAAMGGATPEGYRSRLRDAVREHGWKGLAFQFRKKGARGAFSYIWTDGRGEAISKPMARIGQPKAVWEGRNYDVFSSYIEVAADFDPKAFFSTPLVTAPTVPVADARAEQPAGPRVLVNVVGRDGKTDAERGGPLEPVPAEAGDAVAFMDDLTGQNRRTLYQGVVYRLAPDPRGSGWRVIVERQKPWSVDDLKAHENEPPWTIERAREAAQAKAFPVAANRSTNSETETEQKQEVATQKVASTEEATPQATSGLDLAGSSKTSPVAPTVKGLKNLSAEENAELAELEALFAKKVKTELRSGLDPELVTVAFKIGRLYVKSGARRFRDLLNAMMERMGLGLDQAQPYARNAYNQIRDDMDLAGEDVTDMDDSAEVMAEVRKMRAAAAKTSTSEPEMPISEGEGQETAAEGETDGDQAGTREPSDGGVADDAPVDREAVGPEGASDGGDGGGRDGGTGSELGDDDGREPDGSTRAALEEPAAEAHQVAAPGGLSRKGQSPGNFSIPTDFNLGAGTDKTKIEQNLAAIRLVRQLDTENRYATPSEQAALARYVGWGGLKSVFDVKKADATDMWGKAQRELKELLGPGEYLDAFQTVSNAHYTAAPVVDAMWRAMRHFGFQGGRALEPTVGSGNFLGLQPAEMAAKTEWFASELDTITGRIAFHLYPDATILDGTGFQNAMFREGAFDIAIGNPPFGSETITDNNPVRKALSGMKIHNYVIAKTGMHLRPGGIMGMVVTHRFLDTANPEARAYLANHFRFLGAVRLPNDAFKANAGTEIVTDVVFLQKLKEGETADPNAAWLDTEGQLAGEGAPMRVNRYFAENPDHILGRSAMDGTMYGGRGKGEYTVHSDGRDISAEFDRVVTEKIAPEGAVLKEREQALEAAIAAEDASKLPIGGMQMLDDGRIIRREMDRSITEVTVDSYWTDQAKEWDDLAQALGAIREAAKNGLRPTVEEIDALLAAKDVAYNTGGRKAKSPTKAQQGIYDIVDAIADPLEFHWNYDAEFAAIETTAQNKRLGGKKFRTLKAMLDLRRRVQALLRAEFADAPEIETMRASLAKAYDDFVGEHGFINRPSNLSILQGDVGAEIGLEESYNEAVKDEKTGKVVAVENVSRAAILKRRVNFPYREITEAADPESALTVSLSERGRVDLPYMAKLLNTSLSEVKKSLSEGDEPRIFFNPKNERWEDAEEYLSGNVRQKLEEARAAGMGQNIGALEKAQPEPVTQAKVSPTIRGMWIPPHVFEDFLADLGVDKPQVTIMPSAGMTKADGNVRNVLSDYGQQFQNEHRTVLDIFNSVANGKPIAITRKSADNKVVRDEEATKAVNAIGERMAKEFRTWAYQDARRAEEIVAAYNEKMNTHRTRTYDGEKFLRLVGANTGPGGFQLRRTQKNGAWRLIQQDQVLLDHVVGAGKTLTLVAAIMERRRLGLSKKPLVSVPNHLVMQWAREWLQFYPGARIMAATPKDFEGPNRKRMFARIATGDFDVVIIGHSSLGFMQPPVEDVTSLFEEQIAALQSVLDDQRKTGESKRTLPMIAKRLQKYEEKLEATLNRPRDDLGFDFAEMGIDYLAVDEAHEFKNLEYATGGERLVGMNSPEGSKRAFDLYVKVRGIQKRGGATHFATGTPVSNSLVEAYSMMKYLAMDDLQARSIEHFDAWSASYIEAETRFEYTATQKLKERRVMSGLVNLGSLSQVYQNFADVIDRSDLERIYAEQVREENERNGTSISERFPVPKVVGGGRKLLSAPPTLSQELATDWYVARMAKIKSMASNKEYPKIDNALWVLSDARKSSLDIRTLIPTLPRDENGKVMRSAREIKRIYDKWSDVRGTQLVFSDLSTPSKSAEKNAARTIRDTLKKALGEREGKLRYDDMKARSFADQWADTQEIVDGVLDDPLTDEDRRDTLTEFFNGLENPDADMVVADVGFSVYDDLKAVLIEMGIPEGEIAFIHDYDTPTAKAKLFKRVNAGAVRVLLGSTPKMGAGTNAQERMVGLHHIDSPWRPSDVEQREGRIIRQGNSLYAADPEGFEVEILAYSTTGTSDVVLWQVLERKARSIETFRKGEVDAIEEEGDADSYAEFMAQSTGNPVFRLKLQAEKSVMDETAAVSGALLAKSRAVRFLRMYEDETSDIAKGMEVARQIDPSSITFKGKTGTAADLTAALDAAQGEWQAAYDAYLEKRASALEEREAAEKAGVPDKDLPRLPTAPPRPTMVSEKITKASPYADAVRALLEAADRIVSDGQVAADLAGGRVIVRKSPLFGGESGGISRFEVWVSAGVDTPPFNVATTESKSPLGSSTIQQALRPETISQKRDARLARLEERQADLTEQLPTMERLAEQAVDVSPREDAQALLDYYQIEVQLAEAQADLTRAQRGENIFVRSDRKRSLDASDSAAITEAPSFEVNGQTYQGTGVGARPRNSYGKTFIFEAMRDGDDRRVLVLAEKEESGWAGKEIVEAPKAAAEQIRAIKERRAVRRRIDKPLTETEKSDMVQDLAKRLDKTGIDMRVSLHVAEKVFTPDDNMETLGYFDPDDGLIAVALQGDAHATLDHEIIHMLRSEDVWGRPYGLFTQAEWRSLVLNAKKQKKLVARVRELYGPDFTEAEIIEEVIAEMYAMWRAGRDTFGVSAIFQKIADFFTALAATMTGRGYASADEVFVAIGRGDIGKRSRRRDAGGRFKGASIRARRAGIAPAAPVPDGSEHWRRDPGNFVSDMLTDAMKGRANLLAIAPLRPLAQEIGRGIPSVQNWLGFKEKMDALRQDWHGITDEVARAWRKIMRANPEANRRLMDLMHRATLSGVDPSKGYTPMSPEALKRAQDTIRRTGAHMAPEWATKMQKDEAQRRASHASLRPMFAALPPEFQAMFETVRNTYTRMADESEAAIIENIKTAQRLAVKKAERERDAALKRVEDEGLTGAERDEAIAAAEAMVKKAQSSLGWSGAARIGQLRAQFEANRLKGPYFPLARFGSYYVTLKDKEGRIVSFSRFEKAAQQRTFIEEHEKEGLYQIDAGAFSDKAYDPKSMVDPAFVAEIQSLVGEYDVPPELQDAIWQRWLETLPDLSVRKSRIHRKGTAGFVGDAYRAFASHVFHGAHQLARLKYGLEMTDALEEATLEAKELRNPERGTFVVDEVKRRHDFAMNPTNAPWTAFASSMSFIWFLAFTPAAAMVNMTQTTILGVPILNAAFPKAGIGRVSKELGKALGDFTRGKGHAKASAKLTYQEKLAMNHAYEVGTIDRSQAHDLASVAETGVEYNATRERVMRVLSFAFHHAERLNREVTFLAAYRLAIADGLTDAQARTQASNLTWKIHFDYQNTSRPRIMQSDIPKVLFIFRQFNVNMLWRLFRDVHQVFHGADAQTRREARAQLVGVTLMLLAHGGIRGVWGFGLIMSLLALWPDGLDDDDLNAKLQDALLLEGDSTGVAAWNYLMGMTLNGIPGHVTGTSLSERIGMPNLWFRNEARDLDASEVYMHYVGEVLGPMAGIGESMARGVDYLARGEWWRGAEAMVPKFMRDISKAVRYGANGVETLNGDPLIEDVSPWQILQQAMGFTPAQVAERYAANNRMKNAENRIVDRRRDIQRAAGDAIMAGRAIPAAVLEQIREFNKEYPEYPITGDTLRRSVRGRQTASDRNEFGISINPRLNNRIRESDTKLIYN